MKLITWNCNMAFRKKSHQIVTEKPDILIVQECECPEKLTFSKDLPKPTDVYWYGDNQNKGLGIFSFTNYRIIPLEPYNKELRYIIPLRIENNTGHMFLFAVWAQKPKGHDNYGIHMWKAIKHYSSILNNEFIIITGDFNSNSIWDKKGREANHSNIVSLLEGFHITSVYHHFYNQLQGEEKSPTLYLHRKKYRPYHIDYCFVSERLLQKLKSVKIGSYEGWVGYSDHTPIIVKFGF